MPDIMRKLVAQIESLAKGLALPGESWANSLERARGLCNWPLQMQPCPHCQADYPARPLLWGWIEVGPNSPCIPDMCEYCESDPRQWGEDYEDKNYRKEPPPCRHWNPASCPR
ncbi:hypothetical protein C4K04_2717 [Pseudomonas chlororaphis]|uniref:Uncharacterized protein n=1 Tax=Pseudomonas chlororaphis TaxID=587753 RepID=A0A3G7TQ43_9PSED|nr:hypothetical protein C4K04_2717 [Pseudomonas chlororaphis]